MSAIELTAPAVETRSSGRLLRLFSAGSVATLLTLDVAVVLGAFILAYDLRFVLSDAVAEAFPFELYMRSGGVVGLVAMILLVLQGMGDLDRQRTWPTRLRAISSAVSTGTVLAVLVTFDQDQRLSRAWLALGWSLSIAAITTWPRLICDRCSVSG